MSKKFEETIKEYFSCYSGKEDFGDFPITEIVFDGVTYSGRLVGNDECFDIDGFYQYFINFKNEKIYRMYYDTTNEDGEEFESMDEIDYYSPISVEDCTDEFKYLD